MNVVNPAFSTVSLYLPTCTRSKRYDPSFPLVVLREMPVPVFVRITFAPTTTPPDWSVTVPRSEALVWAQRLLVRNQMLANAIALNRIALRNLTLHPPCSENLRPGHVGRGVAGTTWEGQN